MHLNVKLTEAKEKESFDSKKRKRKKNFFG